MSKNADNADAVKILNELVQVSEDGQKGFAEAANDVKETQLKTLFHDCSTQCASAVDELQKTIQLIGGEASDSGTIAGAAHRGWVKVKAAIADSNVAVLEEVERGQDHAKAAYMKALKAELPSNVRTLVQKQYEGAVRNHDRIRDLRDSYKAAA